MTVVKFPRSGELAQTGWPQAELQRVINASAGAIASGEVSGWEVGRTEHGDPQLYLLGPAPDYDCMLCISRLNNLYILEDGSGHILFEHDSLMQLAEQATSALCRRKSALIARIAIAWCALREAVEEKTDAVLGESFELLTHLAPQLAALA